MPVCYRCHAVQVAKLSDLCPECHDGVVECPNCDFELDRKGICWNCYDPPDDREWEEQRRAYRGGRWIVEGFIRASYSEAEAMAMAEDPGSVRFTLELSGFSGLADILADRLATEALRQLIIAKDQDTLLALADCIKGGRFFPHKPRRGPKGKGGVPVEQEVLRLKREGKSNGDIARVLGIKKSAVAAAYNNITNKIAREQKRNRINNSD